jgi:hypothetical protein
MIWRIEGYRIRRRLLGLTNGPVTTAQVRFECVDTQDENVAWVNQWERNLTKKEYRWIDEFYIECTYQEFQEERLVRFRGQRVVTSHCVDDYVWTNAEPVYSLALWKSHGTDSIRQLNPDNSIAQLASDSCAYLVLFDLHQDRIIDFPIDQSTSIDEDLVNFINTLEVFVHPNTQPALSVWIGSDIIRYSIEASGKVRAQVTPYTAQVTDIQWHPEPTGGDVARRTGTIVLSFDMGFSYRLTLPSGWETDELSFTRVNLLLQHTFSNRSMIDSIHKLPLDYIFHPSVLLVTIQDGILRMNWDHEEDAQRIPSEHYQIRIVRRNDYLKVRFVQTDPYLYLSFAWQSIPNEVWGEIPHVQPGYETFPEQHRRYGALIERTIVEPFLLQSQPTEGWIAEFRRDGGRLEARRRRDPPILERRRRQVSASPATSQQMMKEDKSEIARRGGRGRAGRKELVSKVINPFDPRFNERQRSRRNNQLHRKASTTRRNIGENKHTQEHRRGMKELARKQAEAREELARNNDLGTRPSEPQRNDDEEERSP